MLRLVRGFRSIKRRKIAGPSTAVPPAAPPLTMDVLRDQLADLPPDEKQYLQDALATQESEIKRQLTENSSESVQKSQLDYLVSYVRSAVESMQLAREERMKGPELSKEFWHAAEQISRSRKFGDINLLAHLFELAKNMPHGNMRTTAVHAVGDGIYRKKRIRLDPVNEVEYLDSLVSAKRPFHALRYWKSRKDRADVKNTIYWNEVGALYYLQAGLGAPAETIALEMESRGYVPPRLIAQLIAEFARRPVTHPKLKHWTAALIASAKTGISPTRGEFPADEWDAIAVQMFSCTYDDLSTAFTALVGSANWDLASEVLGAIADTEFLSPDIVHRALRESLKHTRWPDDGVTQFMAVLIERLPVVLEDPITFVVWINGLAKTGEHNEALSIWDALKKQGVEFKISSKSLLARTLFQSGNAELVEKMLAIDRDPTMVAAWLHHKIVRKESDIERLYRSVEDLTSPELSRVLIRVKPLHEILELGNDQQSWRLIWSRLQSASLKGYRQKISNQELPLSAREAFATMINRGGFKWSLNLQEAVYQTFILQRDYVGAGAVAYFSESRRTKLSRLLAGQILKLVSKVAKAQSMILPKGSANVDFVWDPSTSENEFLRASKFVDQLGKRIRSPGTEVQSQSRALAEDWLRLIEAG